MKIPCEMCRLWFVDVGELNLAARAPVSLNTCERCKTEQLDSTPESNAERRSAARTAYVARRLDELVEVAGVLVAGKSSPESSREALRADVMMRLIALGERVLEHYLKLRQERSKSGPFSPPSKDAN